MTSVRRTTAVMVCTAALLPLLASAATIPAGFPNQTIWISDSSLTDGDTATVSTVIYNASGAPVSGTVEFLVDSSVVGTADFTLDSGKSQIETANWIANTGSHAVSARIVRAPTGVSGASGSLAVTVAPAPPKKDEQAIAVQNAITNLTASTSPALSNAAQKTFAFTEGIRKGAIGYLENSLGTSSAATKQKGQVLGANSVAEAAKENTPSSWWHAISTVFLTVMLMIARSVVFFYPFVAIVFFLILYFVAKAVRRPRY